MWYLKSRYATVARPRINPFCLFIFVLFIRGYMDMPQMLTVKIACEILIEMYCITEETFKKQCSTLLHSYRMSPYSCVSSVWVLCY